MMKIKRYKLLLLFLMLRICVMAQTEGYHYRADLDSVKESGVYNIEIAPEINAHLKTDFSDFRIINESGKWIPNFMRHPNKEGGGYYDPVEMNKIKLTHSNNNTTLIVATNESSISHIVLNIKNTNVERFCTITGSDDLINWFAINDSVVIRQHKDFPDSIIVFLRIYFPIVNYKYLKFTIGNNGKAPLDIINVMKDSLFGVDKLSQSRSTHPEFENPNTTFIQKDSGTKSYIRVIQPADFLVGGLILTVSGAKYYERNVKIYKPSYKDHSFSNLGDCVSSFILSNSGDFKFALDNRISAREFYLVIENNDNPPLKIEKIKTASLYTVATAWLEKGQHYSIIMDNPIATEPKYDFNAKLIRSENDTLILKHGIIKSIEQTKISPSPTKNNKWMIWLLIIAAILVLGFFTYKLITDINKSKS